MIVDPQEMYEDILSAHWQKIRLLKELVDTDAGNSALRKDSIAKRRVELAKAESKKAAMELLFDDELTIPDWYLERINERLNYGNRIRLG
jgi:hypothetical protein